MTVPVLPDVDKVEVNVPEFKTEVDPTTGVVERDVEITVNVKVQVPVSPSESLVVPDAEYEPTARLPLVVSTPPDETNKLGAPVDWV